MSKKLKLLFNSLIMLLFISCNNDDSKHNFDNFKIGEFQLLKNNKVVTIIERSNNLQIESKEQNIEIVSISKVSWNGDGSYFLSPIKSIHENVNSLKVEIHDVDKDTAFISVRYTKPWYETFRVSNFKMVKKRSDLSDRFYNVVDSLR